jgi:hypothetical protein
MTGGLLGSSVPLLEAVMVVLKSFPVRDEAEAARSRLEAAGFEAQVLEEPAPPLPVGQDATAAVPAFHVAVAEQDRERAEKVLESE